MCKCTPEIRTPFCGRGDCLPPASREPTESLFAANAEREFARMAHGDHLAQFKADQLDAWERRLAQFSNRSDSTGYVGRIGVEVLTELRQTREQAEALATRAEQAEARETALKAAILDIDAHAAPFGDDADGFVTGGYIISTGCLHRALGVVGHSSRKCTP